LIRKSKYWSSHRRNRSRELYLRIIKRIRTGEMRIKVSLRESNLIKLRIYDIFS
jgi:hypothetical protein